MSGAHRAEKVRRRGRPLSGLLVAAAVLLGATGGLGTFAYWNDVETVEGGAVTAGSLDLTVVDGNGTAIDTWTQLTLAGIAPGESVAAALRVTNAGTTPFTLDAAASGEGQLLPGVDVTLASGVAPATASATYPRAQTCAGATGGRLDAAPTWALGSVAPGEVRLLCVRLALRSAADNVLQGKAVTPTFVFTATQVQP